jgi:esterase/lipase
MCFGCTEALRWLTTREQCWYDRVEDRYYNPTSDAYLAMLVQELKPWVDAHYRTLPGQQHTAVMGSSMGGLVSLYALQCYPEVGHYWCDMQQHSCRKARRDTQPLHAGVLAVLMPA